MISKAEKGYKYLLYLSYFLFIVSFLGISYAAPEYNNTLTEIIKVYICILLIYRFNPLNGKKKCSEFDKQLAFSASVFLFLTTILGQILYFFVVNNVKNDI